MNFLGFQAIGAAWLFALLAPLIAFYFLRLKRPRMAVPSLTLWRQVMADRRVNSPFQKFKRNILLILQALLLIVLALAAMEPFHRARPSATKRIPILIDCSASMAALDRKGGESRLDLARQEARKMIDQMLPDEQLCVITFSKNAKTRIGFTDDKQRLREAVDSIRVEDMKSDLEDAMRMTQAMAQSSPFEEALMLSDGNVPAKTSFDLSFKLNYRKLPPGGPNVGITALNARRTIGAQWDLFISVETSSSETGSLNVAVEREGDPEPLLSRTISPGPGQGEQLLVRVPGDKPSLIRVALTPGGFDSLASDNNAAIMLPAARPLLAYCPEELATYRHALQSLAYADIYPRLHATPPAAYDLLITDKEKDLANTASTVLAVGILPADAATFVAIDQEGTKAIDWKRNHPLLQHVELGDVVFLDRSRYVKNARESDLDALGYDILVHGREGPLLLEKRSEAMTRYYLLAHTDRSTLPYRVGFPILVSNAASQALERAGLARLEAGRAGVIPPYPWPAEEAVMVSGPNNFREEARAAHGFVSGIAALEAGDYKIVGPSGEEIVPVNLLDSSETCMATADEIQFKEDLGVAASSAPVKTDKPLWKQLAVAGFVIMLVEWWFFHRRRFTAR